MSCVMQLGNSPPGSLQLFAMDFAGMGRRFVVTNSSYLIHSCLLCLLVGDSSHTRVTSAYASSERILEVLEVADLLKWKSFSLMAHSYGGGVAALVAGTMQDRVEKLVLVEPVGPLYPIPGMDVFVCVFCALLNCLF
jgi:pimeloyl-ACP methyl ester carboxylesterase